MRKFFTFYVFLWAGYFCFLVPRAAAEDVRGRHIRTDAMLNFSLSSLKGTVEKTTQKNDRLAFENDVLRQSIQELERTRDALAGRKGQAPEPAPAAIDETMDRQQRVRQLIADFERNIEQLKSRLAAMEAGGKGKERASRKHFFKAQKQWESLRRRNERPLQSIEKLKAKQDELAREVKTLEARLKQF